MSGSVGKRTRAGQLYGPRTGAGGGDVPAPGKRALTDKLSRAGTYLREFMAAQENVHDAVAVTTTIEFATYMDRSSVWQTDLKVTGDEAVRACVLMLEAMRGGAQVDWHMEALGFLHQARAELGTPAAVPATSEAMDGGVSVLEEPQAEAGPLASELEQSEPEVVPGTETAPPMVKHTDPGIPGLGASVDEAEELARDLEGQGELEDGFAKKLLQLVDENKGRIISLGLLVGGYALAAKYIGGRIVFDWGWNAAGVEFERHLARSLQVTAELERGLREIEEVKATLQALDNPTAGGPGIRWKTQRARWSRRAEGQIDPNACGPACVKMVMQDHGMPVDAQEEIALGIRGGDEEIPTSADQLARYLFKRAPKLRWVGGMASGTMEDMLGMARRLTASGTWIAEAREGTAIGHFVVVEAIAEDGTVSIRDPWSWMAEQQIPTPETRRGTGMTYKVAWAEFERFWSGVAVWSRATGP